MCNAKGGLHAHVEYLQAGQAIMLSLPAADKCSSHAAGELHAPPRLLLSSWLHNSAAFHVCQMRLPEAGTC